MWKAGKALAWQESDWESCMSCSMWEIFLFSAVLCSVIYTLHLLYCCFQCGKSVLAWTFQKKEWWVSSSPGSNELIPPLNWKWYLHTTLPPNTDHHHTPKSRVPHSGKNSLGGFKSGMSSRPAHPLASTVEIQTFFTNNVSDQVTVVWSALSLAGFLYTWFISVLSMNRKWCHCGGQWVISFLF